MATNLLSFEQAFYTGDYAAVINAQVDSSERVETLQIRALLAEDKLQQALARIDSKTGPVYSALKAYATKSTSDADAVLAESQDDSVRHIVALTHAEAGDFSKALSILSGATQSLDCFLLRVHILLATNRVSEAQRVVEATREWANDHVSFNVGEAWVGLRNEAAQKSYFIFEENNSMHPSADSSLGEAVAQAEMRRFPEAAESLKPALETDSTAAITTALALALIQGDSSEADSLHEQLKLAKHAQSPILADLREKEELFGRVVAKFKA